MTIDEFVVFKMVVQVQVLQNLAFYFQVTLFHKMNILLIDSVQNHSIIDVLKIVLLNFKYH